MKKYWILSIIAIFILALTSCEGLNNHEHEKGAWEIIENSTCQKEGIKVKYCLICDEEIERKTIEKEEHQKSDWLIIEEPTCQKDGLKVQKCSNCQMELERETIEKLDHNIIDGVCTMCNTREIRIGACGPLTGAASMYGQVVKKGIELAIEEINALGGVNINGTKVLINLVDFIDDKANSNEAGKIVTTLIDKKVDLIIGAVTSGATNALISEAIKYGIPVITPTGTADILTIGINGDQREERKNIFRACFHDSYQGKYMAEYTKEAGYEKAYVLFNTDEEYSVNLKEAYVKEANNQGISVTTAEYSSNLNDFTSLWNSIIAGGYECVYIPDYYDNMYKILKTGYTLGYTGVCYGSDGWDGLILQVPNDSDISFLENCFYTNHYFVGSNSKEVKDFIQKYQYKYNGEIPLSFAALGYDAVNIAKQAFEQAGSLEYEKVVKTLTDGTFSGLVTSSKEFNYIDGNPQKEPVIITFKDGKEIEAK